MVKFSELTVIDQQFWKANRNSGIPIRKGKTAISNTGIKSQAIEVSTFIDCDYQNIFNLLQESNINKNMNFQNVNPLNNQANVLLDNLLPMPSDNSQFPISWRIHCAIVLLKYYRSCSYDGVDSRANSDTERKSFNGTVAVVVTMKVIIIIACFYAHKKVMMRIIQKMNDILRGADETMQNIIKSILKSVTTPFKLYNS